MPEVTEFEHGQPCWTDLTARDIDRAVAFYEGVLGWEAGERGGPDVGGYTQMYVGGKPVAALSMGMGTDELPEGAPRLWNTYVYVNDADDVATRVENAGGAVVVAPFDVMDFGRMAVFADPGGAQFSVWQPGTHKGAGVIGETGAMAWSELNAKDSAAAARFYRDVFGWTDQQFEGAEFPYTIFHVGDKQVAGLMEMNEEWGDVKPHWMLYFGTDDVDAVAAKTTELGGTVCVPPTDIPNVGRFAVLADPEGGTFSVLKGTT